MTYKAVRIRAYLQSPVISDKFLPLDGVLYYHLVRREMGEELITKPGESSIREGQGIHLPFYRRGTDSPLWFYHCSFAQWPDSTIEQESFKVKQGAWLRHGDYLYDSVKKIDIQRGKFKAYHIKMYYRSAPYVDWYAYADVDKLLPLLNFCTNLGKNSGDGWGAVKSWEIKDWPEDWSIRGFNNQLMRAVPAEKGLLYGIRPSYWNERHITVCKLPDLNNN